MVAEIPFSYWGRCPHCRQGVWVWVGGDLSEASEPHREGALSPEPAPVRTFEADGGLHDQSRCMGMVASSAPRLTGHSMCSLSPGPQGRPDGEET